MKDKIIKIGKRLEKWKITIDEAVGSLLSMLSVENSNENPLNSCLPIGFKTYKCSDCGFVNIKKDNDRITVGYCDECNHPLWNSGIAYSECGKISCKGECKT